MTRNPDIYLLYEYVDKVPYTVRMKVCLDAPVDAALLAQAAQEAIGRLPYFSVRVGLDPKQNYTLEHNDQPIAVLPEKDECLTLGSEAVHGYLVAITYRGECIWFNFSHTLCDGMGALFWVKATLFQYLTKQHGILEASKDLKLPGTERSAVPGTPMWSPTCGRSIGVGWRSTSRASTPLRTATS